MTRRPMAVLLALALALMLGQRAEAYHFFEAQTGGCRWTNPGSVNFLVDASSTTVIGDALLADANNARSAWNDIATAQDVFGPFTKSAADLTDANFGTAWGIGTLNGASDGQNEVVLDETGDILMDVFGLDPAEINGFGPSRRTVSGGNCTISDAFSLLNGTRTDFDRPSTSVHEFGHIGGLAHSSVGMNNSRNTASTGTSYASPSAALDPINILSTPTMHPFSNGTGSSRATPEQDDVAGLSERYPEASFSTTLGGIQGTVTKCEDDMPLEGVNVRAVSTTNPALQASRYSAFDSNGVGRYVINGLPAGDYRVVVEPMGANGFTAGRMAIKTRTDGGFATEYYGPTAMEEAECTEELPDTALPVSVAAGSTTADIDVKVGGAVLAFVVDDTGSMSNEIDAVQAILNAFVSILEGLAIEFPTTAIVTFKDSVTLRTVSNDPDVLRGVIASLSASGGGDCPESANAALLQAGRILRSGGVSIMFTDADSRPNGPSTNAVSAFYRARSLTLSVLLSATCNEAFPTVTRGGVVRAGASVAACAQNDGRPVCGGVPLSRMKPLTPVRGSRPAWLSALVDEFAEPEMLGTEDAFDTFAQIAAATGGTFLATPRPSGGDSLTEYVNAGTNISVSSVVAATALASPGQGPAGATMNVEITGANTNWNSASVVSLGGGIVVNSRAVQGASSIVANVTIPPEATPGFVDVAVATDLGDGSTENAVGVGAFQITEPIGGPEVTSIVPTRGAPGETIEVTITGLATNFGAPSVVELRRAFAFSADPTITVSGVVADGPTVLRASVTIDPAAEVGLRDVLVTTDAEQALPLFQSFSVAPAPPPVPRVTMVSPPEVSRGASGIDLAITGADTSFVDGATVASFNRTGVTIVSTTVTGPTSATVRIDVAADAQLGFRDIFLTTADEVAAGLDGLQVSGACTTMPRAGCLEARKKLLVIKNTTKDAKDKLVWKWLKGAAVAPEGLGDPTTATGYAFCVYDTSAGNPSLILRAEVAGGPGWSTRKKGDGFQYTDKSGAQDGVQKIVVKTGADRKTQVKVVGKGTNLPDPTLPLTQDPSVTAQLVADGGTCWQAVYSAPGKRKTKIFRDAK